MKKVSGFFVLLLVVGATLSFLNFLSPTCASWFSDLIATNCGDKATLIAVSRKLKESDSSTIKSRSNNKGDIGQCQVHQRRLLIQDLLSMEPLLIHILSQNLHPLIILSLEILTNLMFKPVTMLKRGMLFIHSF
ncbi:hypothetical protein HKD37_14G039553 [Glycine soja]